MTICLKADQTTKMGIVTDVKQELRRANALKVSYAASKSLGILKSEENCLKKRAEVKTFSSFCFAVMKRDFGVSNNE